MYHHIVAYKSGRNDFIARSVEKFVESTGVGTVSRETGRDTGGVIIISKELLIDCRMLSSRVGEVNQGFR